jgi:hypothetical protein
MKKSILILSLTALMFISACSDSTSPESNNPPAAAVAVPEFTTAISEGNNDPNAQSVKTTVENFSAFFALGEAFENIDQYNWEKTGDTWTYSETEGNLTTTVTITETSDGYEFKIIISGTDEYGNTMSGTLLEAYAAKDGTSGYWRFYDTSENPSKLFFSYTWQVDANQTITATMKLYGNDGSVLSQTDLTINSDKSGNYTTKNGNGETMQTATWNADGSGSMTTYYTDPPTTVTWGPNP